MIDVEGATTVGNLPDPRRPGKALALVKCWCGRAYTLTGPQVVRHVAESTRPCPNPECGKGEQ